jgi:hypothetical protein
MARGTVPTARPVCAVRSVIDGNCEVDARRVAAAAALGDASPLTPAGPALRPLRSSHLTASQRQSRGSEPRAARQ